MTDQTPTAQSQADRSVRSGGANLPRSTGRSGSSATTPVEALRVLGLCAAYFVALTLLGYPALTQGQGASRTVAGERYSEANLAQTTAAPADRTASGAAEVASAR